MNPSRSLVPDIVWLAATRIGRLLGWYWAIYVLVILVVAAILFYTGESVTIEVGGSDTWEGSTAAPRYFLLAIGIVAPTTLLTFAVVNGATRREFADALTILFPITAVLMFAVFAAFLGLDQAFGDALPWGRSLSTAIALDGFGGIASFLAETSVIGLAYLSTGWLIGLGYMKWRWELATLFIVPVALPALAIELAFDNGPLGRGLNELVDIAPGDVLPWVAAIVLTLLSLIAARRLTTTVALGSSKARA
ncbi:MAG: hypothetical protein AB7O56_07330 [Bauldia sp.]